MSDFGLIKSFDIDDGQLDGMSPQQCFVLGYELAAVDCFLKLAPRISQTVHAANKERIEKACRDAGREFRLTWMEGDVSEEWMVLTVEGASSP